MERIPFEHVQTDLIRELIRIKSLGIVRVDFRTCPAIKALAHQDVRMGDESNLYIICSELIERAISQMPGPKQVAEAIRMLIGLDRATQFASLEAVRRPRAARIVGYSVSTLARRKELEYISCLANAMLELASTRSANRSFAKDRIDTDVRSVVKGIEAVLIDAPLDLVHTAVTYGLRPILTTANDSKNIRRHFSYRAIVERIEASSHEPYYLVEGTYISRRAFHVSVASANIVFARTPEALDRAFRDRSCISAEYANISTKLWAAIQDSLFESSVRVDGVVYTTTVRLASQDELVLGLNGPEFGNAERLVEFSNTYAIASATRVFPIKLTRHFTIGEVNMEVRLIDESAVDMDAFVYLSGLSENDLDLYAYEEGVRPRRSRFASRQRVVGVRSRPDVLIWPGSGVDFYWQRERD